MGKIWDSNFEIDSCPFCHKKMLWNIETQRLGCYNPECPTVKIKFDMLTDNLISYGDIEAEISDK